MNYDVYVYAIDGSEFLIGNQDDFAAGPWTVSGTPTGVGINTELEVIAKLFEAGDGPGVDIITSVSTYVLYNMSTDSDIYVDGSVHIEGADIYKGANLHVGVDFSSDVSNTVLGGSHPSPNLRLFVEGTQVDEDTSPSFSTNEYIAGDAGEIQDLLATTGVVSPTDGTTYSISASWYDTHNGDTSEVITSFTFVYQVAQISIDTDIINVYSGTSMEITGTITE